jgi:hypothetical protein
MAYRGYTGPRVNDTEHIDGVPWFDSPVPKQRHHCWPQTHEWQGVTRRQRCACGAARINGGLWINRNARRAE